MGGTWDAYDMSPCLGSCGGSGSIPRKFKDKKTGEIVDVYFCYASCGDCVCIFSPDPRTGLSEDWVEQNG